MAKEMGHFPLITRQVSFQRNETESQLDGMEASVRKVRKDEDLPTPETLKRLSGFYDVT